MDSMTDLPEALTSIPLPLLNNINRDFLCNKGQLLLDSAFPTGLKSFGSDHIDNQLHHIVNTTGEHVNTNNTPNTKPEDSNNNNIDIEVRPAESSDSTDDCEEYKEMSQDAIDSSTLPARPPTQLDLEIRKRLKNLRKKHSNDKAKNVAARFRASKRLVNKGVNLRQELQNELLAVLAQKNKVSPGLVMEKFPQSEDFSQLKTHPQSSPQLMLQKNSLVKKNKAPPPPVKEEIPQLKEFPQLNDFPELKKSPQLIQRKNSFVKKNKAPPPPVMEEISQLKDAPQLKESQLIQRNNSFAKKNKALPPPVMEEISQLKESQLILRKLKDNSGALKQLSCERCDNKNACLDCDKSKAATGLLSFSDMPPHLQFNPYITSGYRPILDAWGCIRSLCYVHNETVNIFTHGLPIIYILLTIPNTMPWHLRDTRSQFLIWSHLAGATCPWMGSVLYHLFMNCGSSPLLYKRLLQIDMFGIWISQSFGALPMLFASVHCLSYNIRLLVIASYCLFSIWGLHKALIASTPWSRRICFALPFMMRNLLCILRLTKYGGGAPNSLIPTILQDVVCVIAGVIGAEKVPEKWWPGTTDYCFNSHNLMHLLALLALYYNNRGSVRDIVWMKGFRTCSRRPAQLYTSLW